jgi:MFS family permease
MSSNKTDDSNITPYKELTDSEQFTGVKKINTSPPVPLSDGMQLDANGNRNDGFYGKKKYYAFFVVFILYMVYMSNQMTRLLMTYVKSSIMTDLSISVSEYGFLSGYGFSLIYVVAGMFMGRIADSWNRVWLLFIGIAFWSLMTILSGTAQNYWEFLLARIGLGVGQSVCNPAAFALIADYFPTDYRPLASSLYNSGIYIGGGVSSASVSIFNNGSWREIFTYFGIAGGVTALMLIFVSEPKRGNYDAKPKQDEEALVVKETQEKFSLKYTLTYLASMRTAWIVSLAGGVRSIGGYAFGGFVPSFIMNKYNPGNSIVDFVQVRPDLGATYGTLTAIAGFSTSILAGYITKTYVSQNSRTGAYVSAIGAVASVPFVIGFLFMDVFVGEANDTAYWLSLACIFMAYLTAEVWGGPAAALLQETIPSNMLSTSMSVYFFVLTLIGGAGPELVGLFPEKQNPLYPIETIASPYVLAFIICGSYIFAAILWIVGSRSMDNDIKMKEEFNRSLADGYHMGVVISPTRMIGMSFFVVAMCVGAVLMIVLSFTGI